MFALRLVVLIFMAAYSYGMATETGPLNTFGDIIASSFFLFAPALYFLPTFEAWLRGRTDVTPIALLNVFLGWSLVGWVVALIWAVKDPAALRAEQRTYVPPPPMPPGTERTDDTVEPATKRCPYCAEEILQAAVKCKHCGSGLPAA